MQIVINIDEYLYKIIKTLGLVVEDGDAVAVSEAIKNGTPLPETHGRLIDADILDEVKEMVTTDTGDYKYAVLMDNIRLIPTIIEAEGNTDNE